MLEVPDQVSAMIERFLRASQLAGAGLPVVRSSAAAGPQRQWHEQVARQRVDVGLVTPPQVHPGSVADDTGAAAHRRLIVPARKDWPVGR